MFLLCVNVLLSGQARGGSSKRPHIKKKSSTEALAVFTNPISTNDNTCVV